MVVMAVLCVYIQARGMELVYNEYPHESMIQDAIAENTQQAVNGIKGYSMFSELLNLAQCPYRIYALCSGRSSEETP